VLRVLMMAALICALGTFSLWMAAYRDGHLLERIRESNPRGPSASWARSHGMIRHGSMP
jgi:hypothetical protein